MKFGFELEFFLVKGKGRSQEIVLPPLHMARDGGGILVEARGEPDIHPSLALTRLNLAVNKLKEQAKKENLSLLLSAQELCDAKTLHLARKHKMLSDEVERFAYPTELKHREPGLHLAGLHVHLSDTNEVIEVTKGKSPYGYKKQTHNIFDMFRWLKVLDREFAKEIQRAGRYKGAYKMKSYGYEYRSLPSTVDQDKVVRVLVDINEGRAF